MNPMPIFIASAVERDGELKISICLKFGVEPRLAAKQPDISNAARGLYIACSQILVVQILVRMNRRAKTRT